MKRKMTAIILIIVMISALTSCGNKKGEGGNSGMEGRRVITYYTWVGDDEKKFVQTMISQFESIHPEIDINDNYVPYGEYLSKLSTLEASGTMPEVFQLIEGKVFEWGSKGALLDLAPLFEQSGMDLYSTQVPDSIFGDGTHIYGVGSDLITMVLYYNKDMLKKYGIEAPSSDAGKPWTWDEFRKAAITLTRDSEGNCPKDREFDKDSIVTYGTVMPANWTKLLALLRTNGTSFVSEDGRTLNMTSDKAAEVMNRILDLSRKDQCAPDYSIGADLEANIPTLIMNNQVAMMIEGSWNLSSYMNEGYDIGVAQIPMFETPANVNWSTSICMSKDAAMNQDAFEFLTYMTNAENQLKASKENEVSIGWIPQTKSVLDTEDGMNNWISSYTRVDAEEICRTLKGIIEQNNTTLGENITLKNFNSMMDNKIFPAMESVWMEQETPEEAFSEVDLSEELEGTWR